jgi:hypothetical protein
LGLALGIILSRQVNWFSPGKEKTSIRERPLLIVEAIPRASAEIRSLETSPSAALRNMLEDTPADKEVILTVWRNVKSTEVTVIIKQATG